MARSTLLEKVRSTIRVRHYSLRTEQAYIHRIRRFILFHNKRHPDEMGEPEITAFLSYLAVNRNVSASTQNQALSTILFLYQKVLDRKLEWLDDVAGPGDHNICRSFSRAMKYDNCWMRFPYERNDCAPPLWNRHAEDGMLAPEGPGYRLRLPADHDSFRQRRQEPGNKAACRTD